MPGIEDSIKVNLIDATAAVAAETWGQVIVIGDSSDNTGDFNTVKTFYNQSEVTDYFGDYDIAKATAQVFAQGVTSLKAVETYDDSAVANDYDTVLSDLQANDVEYDIMVPCIDAAATNTSKLVDHVATYSKILVCPDIGDATAVQTDFSGLTANDYIYAIAHDNDSDYTPQGLAGGTAGVLATVSPWTPTGWQKISNIAASGYTMGEVKNTLEANNINTVIQVAIPVLSAGLNLNGGWIDVSRNKQYIASNIQTALVNLKLNAANANSRIPYSPNGIEMVSNTIEDALIAMQDEGSVKADYVNDDGDMVRGYEISVPNYGDISDTDKNNRTLPDVSVTAYLANAVSVISMDLVVTL